MIDLRSDTVTRPTPAMRQAMFEAAVGDDVYGEDPTVAELEQRCASMLGKAAGLFVPSGTQSNLIALLTHCGRGDEYIVGQTAHTYRLEGGGAAALGGIQPQPLDFEADGTLDLDAVSAAIKPDDFHYARTTLLNLENTQGGKSLPLDYIQQARAVCNQYNIALHLDGARFFNAAIDRALSTQALAQPFDSISICLSKGLGAPVGSVLVGNETFINEGRRWRKVLGGGMRQAGVIAAAGLYALQHHVERLQTDHARANHIALVLSQKFELPIDAATNMVHVNLGPEQYRRFAAYLKEHKIIAPRPRWVFHLDLSEQDIERLAQVISTFPD